MERERQVGRPLVPVGVQLSVADVDRLGPGRLLELEPSRRCNAEDDKLRAGSAGGRGLDRRARRTPAQGHAAAPRRARAKSLSFRAAASPDPSRPRRQRRSRRDALQGPARPARGPRGRRPCASGTPRTRRAPAPPRSAKLEGLLDHRLAVALGRDHRTSPGRSRCCRGSRAFLDLKAGESSPAWATIDRVPSSSPSSKGKKSSAQVLGRQRATPRLLARESMSTRNVYAPARSRPPGCAVVDYGERHGGLAALEFMQIPDDLLQPAAARTSPKNHVRCSMSSPSCPQEHPLATAAPCRAPRQLPPATMLLSPTFDRAEAPIRAADLPQSVRWRLCPARPAHPGAGRRSNRLFTGPSARARPAAAPRARGRPARRRGANGTRSR